jgi:hypothetical protein
MPAFALEIKYTTSEFIYNMKTKCMKALNMKTSDKHLYI